MQIRPLSPALKQICFVSKQLLKFKLLYVVAILEHLGDWVLNFFVSTCSYSLNPDPAKVENMVSS